LCAAAALLALVAAAAPRISAEPVYTVVYGGDSDGAARFVDDLTHLWEASNVESGSRLAGRAQAAGSIRLQALRRMRAQFAIVDADEFARRKAGSPDIAAVALLWPEALHVLARRADTAPLAAPPPGDLFVTPAALYGQTALAALAAAPDAAVHWLVLPPGGLAAALQRRPLPLLLASGVPPLPDVEQALREPADLKLLALPRTLIDSVRAASPWLQFSTLPARTYVGQGQAVETIGVYQVLVTRTDAPADLVQHMLAALYRWQERMASANPRFAALDRKANAAAVAWFPFHAAALKELGLAPPERPAQ
jgi:TRAP-type uncharacterized transport system substrate-binding protein